MTAIDDSVEMIRHDERLRLSTETFALERVRLQRYIIAEERTITVTVRREEVRLVREPLDQSFVPTEHEEDMGGVMILSEERVVVDTEIVPVERVWLRKERIVEQQRVSDVIRSERIDVVPSV